MALKIDKRNASHEIHAIYYESEDSDVANGQYRYRISGSIIKQKDGMIYLTEPFDGEIKKHLIESFRQQIPNFNIKFLKFFMHEFREVPNKDGDGTIKETVFHIPIWTQQE